MSGHCKDCMHWSTKSRDDVYPNSFNAGQPKLKWRHRACLKVVDAEHAQQNSFCEDIPLSNEQKINLPSDIAFVDVYEVYANELMTGPGFGCVHFEERDSAQ